MVGGKWKTYIGVGLEFPWAIGYSLLPGIALILPVYGSTKFAMKYLTWATKVKGLKSPACGILVGTP